MALSYSELPIYPRLLVSVSLHLASSRMLSILESDSVVLRRETTVQES